MIPVKICGITTPDAGWSAICNGAAFIGFVFYPPSPRVVTPEQAAEIAKVCAGQETRTVALFVDPSEDRLQSVFDAFAPNIIQLHGDEPPERVAWIRTHAARPVIKAIGVSGPEDLEKARVYEDVADWILFDAKPPKGASGGGYGAAFDWSILKDYRGAKPWMLSGGLNAQNITHALSICKPDAIDLSSGVEDAPGHKSDTLMSAFFSELSRIQE